MRLRLNHWSRITRITNNRLSFANSVALALVPPFRRANADLVEEPSDEVALAADRVAITRSTLEQRKVEREIEENEDWFRNRERRDAETVWRYLFSVTCSEFLHQS